MSQQALAKTRSRWAGGAVLVLALCATLLTAVPAWAATGAAGEAVGGGAAFKDALAEEREALSAQEAQPQASSEPKTTTIDGVEYTYSINWNDERGRNEVWVRETSWAPLITIPRQIEGCEVVEFDSTIGVTVNNYVRFDVSQATSLEDLSVYGCMAIDVSNNKALRELSISGNFSGGELDVSSCELLEELWCDGLGLHELDVTNNPRLRYLSCSSNFLTHLDLSKNLQLTGLTCTNNLLDNAAQLAAQFTGETADDKDFFSGVYPQCVVNSDGLVLRLTWTNITNFQQRAQVVGYRGSADAVVIPRTVHAVDVAPNSGANDVREYLIDQVNLGFEPAEGQTIPTLDVRSASELGELRCYGWGIRELLIGANDNLWRIECGDNELAALDVSGCPSLTRLECDGNQLSSIDVSSNPKLNHLAIGHEIKGSDKLAWNSSAYTVRGNNISSLDVSNNPELEYLFCTGNNLTALDVSSNPKLIRLLCPDNDIKALDLSNNPKLEYLHCMNNRLTELDVSANPLISVMRCHNNNIADTSALTARFGTERYVVLPQRSTGRIDSAAGTAAATSANISKEAFPEGSEWVVLARDDDFADAMSATGLAGALDAPIVLTDRASLSPESADELRRLQATKAYVIGGDRAMSGDFEGALAALGFTQVTRVFGSECWDTSVACARKIAEHGGNELGEAIVAMSLNFQDALSISSFAYAYGVPIFLQTAEGDRPLPQAAVDMVEGLGGAIYVPGGTGAVRESTVEGVFAGRQIVRMFGTDGYDTSNQIATWMVANGKLTADTVCLACGAPAPKGSDALAGAAFAGRRGGVLLLANANTGIDDVRLVTVEGVDSQGTPAFLASNATFVSDAYILGGSFVMPNEIHNKVESVLS